MKKKPILPSGYTVPTHDMIEFIHWYEVVGLHETALMHVAIYRLEIKENLDLEQMRHRGFWSKSSI